MSDTQRTLDELLVDEEEVNEDLLVGILSDYVQIGKNKGSLIPTPAFEELNAREKIVVALLAQKARYELELADSEWMSPTEISDAIGMKKNTIYPRVRELEETFGLVDNDDGSYRLPSHKFTHAKQIIRGET